MAKPSPDSGDSDYSASATLVHFDRPIPPLRRPVPAGPNDDPNLGPFVLAFPNLQSFSSALRFCESKLLEQCQAGVRIGCSIAASNKCRPPWWKTLFGGASKIDFRERNECEEREMAACLEGSKEKCANFAREKCVGPFRWARVACRGRKLREKEMRRLISCVSGLGVSKGNVGFLERVFVDQLRSLPELNLSYEVTTIRGSEILRDRSNTDTNTMVTPALTGSAGSGEIQMRMLSGFNIEDESISPDLDVKRKGVTLQDVKLSNESNDATITIEFPCVDAGSD